MKDGKMAASRSSRCNFETAPFREFRNGIIGAGVAGSRTPAARTADLTSCALRHNRFLREGSFLRISRACQAAQARGRGKAVLPANRWLFSIILLRRAVLPRMAPP